MLKNRTKEEGAMQMRVVQHHINYTWIFIMLSKNKTCRNLLKCCGTQTLIVSPQKRKKERKKERKKGNGNKNSLFLKKGRKYTGLQK